MGDSLLNQSLEKLEMESENAKKTNVGEEWINAVNKRKQGLADLVNDHVTKRQNAT